MSGAVMVFNMVATLGGEIATLGGAIATLEGVVSPTLGAGTTGAIGASGWPDKIWVSCWIAAMCFNFSRVNVRPVTPISSKQCLIVLRNHRDLAMAQIESPSVSDMKTARRGDVKAKTTIVIGSQADVISVGGVGCPRRVDCWVIVNERLGAERRKRHLCEIERTVELLICQDEWIATGEMKEVERYFHLG